MPGSELESKQASFAKAILRAQACLVEGMAGLAEMDAPQIHEALALLVEANGYLAQVLRDHLQSPPAALSQPDVLSALSLRFKEAIAARAHGASALDELSVDSAGQRL